MKTYITITAIFYIFGITLPIWLLTLWVVMGILDL